MDYFQHAIPGDLDSYKMVHWSRSHLKVTTQISNNVFEIVLSSAAHNAIINPDCHDDDVIVICSNVDAKVCWA